MVNQITDKQKEIYIKYDVEGLGYRSIAQDQDLDKSTVREHIKAVEQKIQSVELFKHELKEYREEFNDYGEQDQEEQEEEEEQPAN